MDRIRSRIRRGKLAPGDRLPTQVELQKRFGTTSATVQKALTRLAEEGLVRAEGRRGTFVRANPPHLNEYALAFPAGPSLPNHFWSRFHAGVLNQAAALSQQGKRRVLPFYGLDLVPQSPDYPALLERVQSQRLAGIIFASHPYRLAGTPVLEQPGIPRVALMQRQVYPHVPAVATDEMFCPKALDYLASRGRGRVALITFSTYPQDFANFRRDLQPLLAARQMITQRHWTMPFVAPALEGVAIYLEALLRARREDRPDALVIMDDNLTEYAVAGLVAAGVRVGDELDVVTHCNFPWAGPTTVPMTRLGYDGRTILHTCIDLIDRQRRGESVPSVTTVPCVFEDELKKQEAKTLASGDPGQAKGVAS